MEVLKWKMFLNFPINNKKTPVLESLFNKIAGLKAYNTIKMTLQHSCLPAINAKALRTAFF